MLLLCLTVSLEGHTIVLLHGSALGRSLVDRAVALDAQTSRFLSSSRQSAHLAVLVGRAADPVDAGILANGAMLGINENNLKVQVRRVLVDPVAVEHAQIGAAASDASLGQNAVRASGVLLVDTLVGGLTVHDTAVNLFLASTATHARAVHDVALLGLVAETMSLVGARGTRQAGEHGLVPVLPASRAQQKAHHVGLLPAPHLLLREREKGEQKWEREPYFRLHTIKPMEQRPSRSHHTLVCVSHTKERFFLSLSFFFSPSGLLTTLHDHRVASTSSSTHETERGQ